MTPTESESAARIVALEQALKREREVSAAERRRADVLEETARRAYRMAVDLRPRARNVTETD